MASSPDTFDGLLGLLRESLRTVGADVGRLAEQHRLEIERLGPAPLSPVKPLGEEALRLLQPRLAADLGATVELPPEAGEFQRLRATVDDTWARKPAAVVPLPPLGEDPKPLRAVMDSLRHPQAIVEEAPSLAKEAPSEVLEELVDAPGVVKEQRPTKRQGCGTLTSVMPLSPKSLGEKTRTDSLLSPDSPTVVGSSTSDAGGRLPAGVRILRPAGARMTRRVQACEERSEDSASLEHHHPDAALAGEQPCQEARKNFRDRVRQTMRRSSHRAEPEDDDRHSRHSEHGFASLLKMSDSFQAGRRQLLPDLVDLKEQVRNAIAKPKYRVADLYHDEGCFQRIARSYIFDVVSLVATFLNAGWIGLEMDFNTAAVLFDAPAFYQVGEHFFCVFFLAEWIIRFGAFKRKRDVLKDSWLIIDGILAFMLVVDTWIMLIVAVSMGMRGPLTMGDASVLRLLKVVRLVRLARMTKLLRAFPELVVVVRGIGVAVRSVFFTLCLQIFVVYVFAVTCKRLTESSDTPSMFPSVFDGMRILFLQGILPDFAPLVTTLGDSSPLLGFVAVIFVLLASITIMNFIVGVLVEVVKVTSTIEREYLQACLVKRKLHEMLKELGIDEDRTPKLTQDEFQSILLHPKTALYMQDMGVDVVGLVDFIDIIFRGGQDYPLADFFHLVMSLRGSNPTTVKDIVDLRNYFIELLQEFEESLLRQILLIHNGGGLPKVGTRAAR